MFREKDRSWLRLMTAYTVCWPRWKSKASLSSLYFANFVRWQFFRQQKMSFLKMALVILHQFFAERNHKNLLYTIGIIYDLFSEIMILVTKLIYFCRIQSDMILNVFISTNSNMKILKFTTNWNKTISTSLAATSWFLKTLCEFERQINAWNKCSVRQ